MEKVLNIKELKDFLAELKEQYGEVSEKVQSEIEKVNQALSDFTYEMRQEANAIRIDVKELERIIDEADSDNFESLEIKSVHWNSDLEQKFEDTLVEYEKLWEAIDSLENVRNSGSHIFNGENMVVDLEDLIQ